MFELDLLRYMSVTEPIARSIECLEATDTNVADVYLFWLAIAATMRDLFDRSDRGECDTSIPNALAMKVTAIINRRYKEFIDESPSDIYFSGFFLDPRMIIYRILQYRPLTFMQAMYDLIFFANPHQCRMLFVCRLANQARSKRVMTACTLLIQRHIDVYATSSRR